MWPFRKRPTPDWRGTGEHRWTVVKQQGDFMLERYELEAIDMNSGDRRWFPKRDIAAAMLGAEGFTERIRNSETETLKEETCDAADS
jgi:hypothetical protein